MVLLDSSFREKYTLPDSKPLGKGGYAVVYRCVNRETKEEFAVKVIEKSNARPKDIQSLDYEIKVMEMIGYHPNVVQLVDQFESENRIYIVLDLLAGGMVFDRVVQLRNYTENDASTLVRNILGALAHVHSKGIIHRDIKPENLLLRHKESGSNSDNSYLTDVCLADFGLAGTVPSLACCGSPSYIAPEVIKVGYLRSQQEPYDAKCDIWSLGVITYILLCGRMPFGGSNYKETFQRIVCNRWEFCGSTWDKVSPTAKEFIKTCLTPEPERRPSAKELLHHPWVAAEQAEIFLDDSLEELRKFTAQEKVRAAVRVFCATQSLLGKMDRTPPFMKYLRHPDTFSTIIEAQSQTDRDKTHYIDFGKALLRDKPGWRIQDCCTCASQMVCRHIQNVNEYLFVGKRSMDVYPFMDELAMLKMDTETELKETPKNASLKTRLKQITNEMEAANIFSEELAKVPREQWKPNLMLEGPMRVPTNAKTPQGSPKTSSLRRVLDSKASPKKSSKSHDKVKRKISKGDDEKEKSFLNTLKGLFR